MKKQVKKYYTIYSIDKNTLDLHNEAEYTKRDDACQWLGVTSKHLTDYLVKDIEHITCKLREDKYFIMIDEEVQG